MSNSINYIYVLLSFLINIVMLYIGAFRYKLILKNLQCKITTLHSLIVLCAAQFTNSLAPFKTGVLITKPLLTKELSDANLKKSFLATFYEQAYDLVWQIFLLPILILYVGEKILFNQAITKSILVVIVVLIFILLLIYRKKVINMAWKLKYFIPKRIKAKIKQYNIDKEFVHNNSNDLSKYLLNSKFFFYTLLPTLLIILINPLIIYFIILAFSMPVSYSQAFLIYWMPMIIGRLSGLPGGLGSRDITMAALLNGIKVSNVIILQAIVLYRIVTILPIVLIGLPALIYYGKNIAIKRSSKQKK